MNEGYPGKLTRRADAAPLARMRYDYLSPEGPYMPGTGMSFMRK
jgi:hypothetical protein